MRYIFLLLSLLFAIASSSEIVAAPAKKNKPLILIDPGHGGDDFGTCSADRKYKEKQLTLTTAILVRKHLSKSGYRSVLLRNRDVAISKEERIRRANKAKADLYVSIHYNWALNKQASGIEIFYHANAKSEKEKRRFIASRNLAKQILNKICLETHQPSRGIKKGAFYVIKNAQMPAVLVEAGFMSNISEMNKLKDHKFLNSIALGIAKGIIEHLDMHQK